ncbi:ssDNA-binding protein [Bifidobacterium minimum]|uniref:SsDNA-binding protein n=1 Tax=Bifidobacterium minimum TaxID=1693 RepID=A0A087BMX7_9BIFI|nr:single-stranded DNA-binding protein [Bifidobacterium minimum]KFI72377.1 ssDNA-binding protein [Bifidobacterium minimum]
MTQQGTVIITGFVGSEPSSFGREGGAMACSFRLGCTGRFFDARQGEWKDRPTVWVTVKAFRGLAANILMSVHKGDPVMVVGSLGMEEWTKDGAKRNSLVVQATDVGHDLTRGTSVFTKTPTGSPADDPRVQDGGDRHARGGEPDPVDAGIDDGYSVGGM